MKNNNLFIWFLLYIKTNKMKIMFIAGIAALFLFSCTDINKKTVATENKSDGITVIKPAVSAYDFKLKNIDGKEFSLKEYSGKKILIVNTASQCGFTPQYEDLEALYKKYTDKLVVVGFPANNFGKQEPGTNEEIKSFCKKNYGVSFPLSEKISVVGADAAPLFQWLVSKNKNGVMDASINWNFSKFLLDEKGHLIAAFPSDVKPMDEAITSKL
jgi:glutathione peroxidase